MTQLLSQERFTEFGIPPEAFKSGKPVETTIIVYDLKQLKDLLNHGFDDAGRQAHIEALFDGIDTSGDDGLMDRVHRHIYGNEELSQEDRDVVEPALPLPMTVFLAAEPYTVKGKWDISTPDGTLRVVEVTELTIEQGGYIVCSATPLSFTCDTVIRKGNTGSNNADFNILGATPPQPRTPDTPKTADQASKGKDGECSSGGIAGSGGQRGSDGGTGTHGTEGTRGSNGKPSQQATIVIQKALTADKLTIFTQSGPGGRGGDGGQGGKGQQGGKGGDGVSCGCTGNGGGPGANGGKGGDGGRAGNGGDGVDAAANIVVKVPHQADVNKVEPTYASAPPGEPGAPGPGGDGGAGGSGGGGGKHNNGGGPGGGANPGERGGQGDAGKTTGKPAKVDVKVF
jgi:hypothetical protein